MLITILILAVSAAFFVSGKFRSDIVALCALLALLIFQIRSHCSYSRYSLRKKHCPGSRTRSSS